ncbi:MAG: metal ABC transporter substrate-binding protein [Colwellia sp.]|nr:metal ABC transporter substrate-binding protein [Colwellia sp.]
MLKMKIFVVLLFVSFCMISCGKQQTQLQTEQNKISITTVNYPLYYFTQQLAGDFAQVNLPIPKGIDPAQWQPNIDDILLLQQADLLVLNGDNYSPWLTKISIADNKLIDTLAGLESELIQLDTSLSHSHGPEGDHSHDQLAITTWMDMKLAKKQAQNIIKVLTKRYPEHSQSIKLKAIKLISELVALDLGYQEQITKLQSKTLVFSHPVYQYFKQGYQLTGTSLHWEPNEIPNSRQWAKLSSLSENSSDLLFIWEDEPNDEIKTMMDNLNIEYLVIRPAANKAAQSWLTIQQVNISQLSGCCIIIIP